MKKLHGTGESEEHQNLSVLPVVRKEVENSFLKMQEKKLKDCRRQSSE